MSRGYDGPEIDDFRDSGWGRDGDSSSWGRGRSGGSDWQTRADVKRKLLEAREIESRSDQRVAHTREHLENNRPSSGLDDRHRALLKEQRRETYTDRDRGYALRPSEIHTLTEVGRFRVVVIEDLAKFAYADDRVRMESDLRNLKEQKVIEQRGTSAFKKESQQVLSLTKQGERLIRTHGFLPEDQAVYSGLVKPKEAKHDAYLYRLYHSAADEIERKGGRVLRVRLDYELKEKLYERLGRAQARGDKDLQRLKEAFARDLNLPVVHGKVSFPDLRLVQSARLAR